MATPILSPNRIAQRLREHRTAVAVLAMQSAKRAVKADIRTKGLKPAHYSAREISVLAEAYLAQHREQLRAEAEHTIATWPGFARWRLPCSERVSGAKTDRQQLAKAIATLTPGDTLIVTKLDRLARSTRDLLNTLDAIGKAGATFKSLGDGWADTTTPHGRLMLTVLGGLAEFERHLILARTSEGRQRAQQRGVRFGRRPKLTAHQQQEALARRAAGEALVEIARSYAVSHSTISRLA